MDLSNLYATNPDEYGMYVGASYAVTFTILFWLITSSLLSLKKAKRQLERLENKEDIDLDYPTICRMNHDT